MERKAGDKVKVKNDLATWGMYSDCRFSDEMEKYKGKILTIKSLEGKFYRVLENHYFWSNEMFEGEIQMEKIRTLKELDGLVSWKEIKLKVDGDKINIIDMSYGGEYLLFTIYLSNLSLEEAFEWLNPFGFELKRGEPKKISKRLYHFCKVYPNRWVAVNEDGVAGFYKEKPRRDNHYWDSCWDSSFILPPDDMEIPLTWEDEPIKAIDLSKWEVEVGEE